MRQEGCHTKRTVAFAEDRYGFFRPVIRETVSKYLGCGGLKQDFARRRCRDCGHEFLLAYFCKGRYFCTLPDGAGNPGVHGAAR